MEVKEEIKLLKAFSKLWKESNNELETIPDENVFYLSANAVYGIVLKTPEAKNIFKRFIDKDRIGTYKEPPLSYNPDKLQDTTTSKYSVDLLQDVLKCFSVIDDKAKFSIKKDYPLLIEGTHFNFIIAPIVDND